MAGQEMKTIDKVTYSLVVLGGLNWGLLGVFKRELVVDILGFGQTLSRIIYTLIGASAVYCLVGIVSMMQEENAKKS